MAELKSRDVAGFLKRPEMGRIVYLAYGPDRGLVTEIMDAIANSSGIKPDDTFGRMRMSSETASNDQGLTNEAYTVGMFAGKRLLKVADAGNDKLLVDQVKQLLADPPQDVTILLEGGDLKKGSALRSLIEKSSNALAIPCYVDDQRAVQTLVDDFFPSSNALLDATARQYLAANIGADRAVSRRELEKIALLVADERPATMEEVSALVGDSAAFDANAIIDSVIIGDVDGFDANFLRFQTSGGNVNTLYFAAIRQFQQLNVLRVDMDTYRKPSSAAIAAARPPVFFSRKKIIERALGIWTAPAIMAASEKLQDALLRARMLRSLDFASTHICLLGLAISARRRR